MDKTVAAIELTSKQIKIVIGYELNGQVFVLYTLTKPTTGLIENGKVIDTTALAHEIEKVVDIYDGQAKLKIKISEVLLLLPPCGLEVYGAKQTCTVTSEDQKVSQIDINNLYNMIKNEKIPNPDNVLVDIVPNVFTLDNDRNSFNPPIGESSSFVKIFAKAHTLPPSISRGYFEAVHKAELKVNHSIVAPFAAVELLNTYEDMPNDYFLVDMGSKLTSVSLVGKKVLYGSRCIGFGGDNITNAIANQFNISFEDAEHLKILYGIDNRQMEFKAPICTSDDGNGNQIKHYADELNAIIKSNLNDFVKSYKVAVDELLKNYDPSYKRMPLVFIGGGSLLNNLVSYITPKVENDAITAISPKSLGARNPGLFNCLGAVLVHSKYPVTVDDSQPKMPSVSRNIK